MDVWMIFVVGVILGMIIMAIIAAAGNIQWGCRDEDSLISRKDFERPQAKWIEKEETPASVSYYCSNCKMEGVPVTPFCPWCGAEMHEEEE